jgi:hypothetical protein
MYSEKDSAELLEGLEKRLIRSRKVDPAQLKKMSREKQAEWLAQAEQATISYGEFIALLLNFQLKQHEYFLADFVSRFQGVDGDRNGILNEDEFRDLARGLGVTSDRILRKYLKEVDPFNNEKITFSQCVQVFSTEGIEEDGKALLSKHKY